MWKISKVVTLLGLFSHKCVSNVRSPEMGFLIGVAVLYGLVPMQYAFVCCVLGAACSFEVPLWLFLEHNP